MWFIFESFNRRPSKRADLVYQSKKKDWKPFASLKVMKYEDKKLVIDYATKDIVIRIFDLYYDGYSYQKISNLFNSEKVLGKSNWCDSTIVGILENEIYKGDFVHGKKTKHPTYTNILLIS